ncbi:hypothetical protein DSUL_50059 [Desulfovibrionales bacterium]
MGNIWASRLSSAYRQRLERMVGRGLLADSWSWYSFVQYKKNLFEMQKRAFTSNCRSFFLGSGIMQRSIRMFLVNISRESSLRGSSFACPSSGHDNWNRPEWV